MKYAHFGKRNKGVLVQLIMVFLIAVLLLSCGTGKRLNWVKIDNYNELREVVFNGEFEIENQWANPLSGSMIDLTGNPNYLRFENDSVDLFLPYFGVRHAGGNYGGREGGIVYKGIAEELQITEADNNSKIEIEFEAEDGSEDYDFRITLYPNGNASTSVTSSQRNSISYQGTVKRKSEEPE